MNFVAMLKQIQGGLIVSCQATEDEPLYGSEMMVRMAKAAMQGGAVGIRANSPVDIAAIRHALPDVLLIGLYKYDLPGYAVRITPTLHHAISIAEAGCDIIALDATDRPHPKEDLASLIQKVKAQTGLPILADVSTAAEGLEAVRLGADMVGTTLSGYTDYSPAQAEPDLALVKVLSAQIDVPLIAEGRLATPDHVRQALELGAFAAVVGGAITRPQWITQQFVKAIKS